VKTAHSLYIQALAELGPLGLAVILVGVLTPLFVLRNRRDPLLAGAGGAYLAFVLHAGVDWDWELPAVMIAGVFCGAAVLVYGRDSRRRLSLRGRVLLGLPLAAVAVLACVRVKTGGGLPFGP
jgi:peptidoglycan/LPS O-acetylase OafA/YrhL